MDYKGQELFELITWAVVAVWGVVAFAVGWAAQDFSLMAMLYAAGGAALLLFLPDHKWYPPSWLFNGHPVQWLPALDPPNAPPPPPTPLQRVLKLLGIGGSSKKTSKAASGKSAASGRKLKGGKAR